MTGGTSISEDMIQAFVDGRLPAARAQEVEAYLATAPTERERVAAYMDQRRQLRDALSAKFDEPLPQRLRVTEVRRRQRQRQLRRITALAAMLAVAIVGATAGWIAAHRLQGAGSDPLVAEALSVRAGGLRPDRTLGATALATPDAGDKAVAAALGVPARVPDLAKAGYVLSAISILHDEAGPALQLAYRDAAGTAFTLFMRRSHGSDRFDLSRAGSLEICVWQNDSLSVVMLGEMPAREMLKVATMTYSALDF